MPIAVHDLEGGVTRVVLSGRIDIAGAQEIDMPTSVVAGSRRAVVIHLSDVSFIASMGLRCLVSAAKMVSSKLGRMVLPSPTANVETVIKTTGIDTVISIFHDAGEAIRAVNQYAFEKPH
jgi:stage II sporulation protein AA (anti-sigma F factor antagonist)